MDVSRLLATEAFEAEVKTAFFTEFSTVNQFLMHLA